jgi:beta-lactamase class A
MLTRRCFFIGPTALAGCAWLPVVAEGTTSEHSTAKLERTLRQIEQHSSGRLGVCVLDTQTGRRIGLHENDRFPMCSTFKLLAAAAILRRVDEGQEQLDRRLIVRSEDIVVYSPITKGRIGRAGITISELCEAATTLSDNTAANLLLASLGGPSAVTDFARSLGDTVTRLDRIEPDLNQAVPGDPRDTTTPAAMLGNIHALILGNALSAGSRDHLTGWILGNQTGNRRLRAGLPSGWRCGEKTGSGDRGTSNDVGVLWPPRGPPIIVTAYLTEAKAGFKRRDAALAAVGRAVAEAFAD